MTTNETADVDLILDLDNVELDISVEIIADRSLLVLQEFDAVVIPVDEVCIAIPNLLRYLVQHNLMTADEIRAAVSS